MFRALLLEKTDGKVTANLRQLEDSALPDFAAAYSALVTGRLSALMRMTAASLPGQTTEPSRTMWSYWP